MSIEIDNLLANAIRDGIREGIKKKLSDSYGTNAVSQLIDSVLTQYQASIRQMLEASIASCIGDATFREEIAASVRHKLASTLIQRFGGEMEKQVNVLKSDPTTRARITLAIEEIVKTKT